MTLRNLYFTRAAFSIIWIILIACFISTPFATILLIIYPAWDLIATLMDRQSKIQYLNAAISAITTIAVGIALQKGVPETLIVFGIWAILTGLIQLILAIKRKHLDGQWPMIISGVQSMIAGASFITVAHDPGFGLVILIGYAAFGAFYFLISAFRLSRTRSTFAG